MKAPIITFLVSLFVSSVSAQTLPINAVAVADQMPEPIGDINKFISDNLVYPLRAVLANKEGRVVIKFIVDSTGAVVAPEVARSVYPSLDSAALLVISKMPRWKPGLLNGKPVNVYYSMPVSFKLEDMPVGNNDSVYTIVDQMPVPTFDINAFLNRNLHYPAAARINNIEGRVIVQFVINEDGNIINISVLKSVSKSIDDEAIRVIQAMPGWSPGKKDGHPVKVLYQLPIAFRLDN